MKNRLIIGLEGAVINNGNMGCVALTCSILNMLEKISKELSSGGINCGICEKIQGVEIRC